MALNVAREDLVVGNGEALIFRAEVPSGTVFERQYQHERKPRLRSTSITYGLDTDAWITYERPSADESITSLDFLATLESTALGSTEQPVEYYMGIPIFIQVQYPVVYTTGAGASANFEQVTRKAPKGLRIEVVSTGFTLGEFYTDEHGQIWGMLLQANESDTALDVTIQYEMSDPDLGLPALEGEVVEGGAPITQYTANKDFYTDTPFFSSWKTGIGKPFAISMATLQVGLVEIGGSAISEFTSTDGRHAGLLHAFQQVRYVHQWFHYLTQGFTFGTNPDGTPKDESWEQILDNHDQNGTGKVYIGTPDEYSYDILLPKIRVTTPRSTDPATGDPDINEGVTGEVSYINAELATGLRWWLILYGFDKFKMNQNVQVPDGSGGLILQPINELDNKAQFWRVHTIWHEFTHAVINMAIERLFNLDMSGSQTAAKDASTSGRLDQIIFDTVDAAGNKILSGGWSTLEEGLAAIPELALHEKATGKTPHFHPVPPASPRYLYIDTDASGTVDGTVNPATDLNLSQGTSINLNLGSPLPALYDRRISLRVPIAFTWALWSGLKDTGGFNTTLLSQVTGNVPLNDLTDAVAYLDSTHLPQAKQIFQALFWGPLIGMRPATRHVSPPPQWSDINGPANGPTTFSFMQMIETQFWAGLGSADKTRLKELFEDANNPESYHLWFNFT